MDFIGCVCFGKTAEFVEKWQGMKMGAAGRIKREVILIMKDKIYTTDVVEEVEFVESKANNLTRNDGFQKDFSPEPSSAMGDGFMNIPDGIDEELPFN